MAPHIIAELKTSSDDSIPSAISVGMPEEAASDLGQGKDQIDENSRQQKLAALTRPATYEIHENATNCES
jgi:hypothetical protein